MVVQSLQNLLPELLQETRISDEAKLSLLRRLYSRVKASKGR